MNDKGLKSKISGQIIENYSEDDNVWFMITIVGSGMFREKLPDAKIGYTFTPIFRSICRCLAQRDFLYF